MKNYALIGNPVNQSPTPQMMNDLFKMNGVDAFYTSIQLPVNRNFAEFQGIFDGYNITYPFKRNAGGNIYIPGCLIDSTDGEAFFCSLYPKTIPRIVAIRGYSGGASRSIRDFARTAECECVQWVGSVIADVYVNATPVDFEFDGPEGETLVYDLKYTPTLFLKSAKEKGHKTQDGKLMLYYNALISFRKFTEKEPTRESRETILDKLMGGKYVC